MKLRKFFMSSLLGFAAFFSFTACTKSVPVPTPSPTNSTVPESTTTPEATEEEGYNSNGEKIKNSLYNLDKNYNYDRNLNYGTNRTNLVTPRGKQYYNLDTNGSKKTSRPSTNILKNSINNTNFLNEVSNPNKDNKIVEMKSYPDGKYTLYKKDTIDYNNAGNSVVKSKEVIKRSNTALSDSVLNRYNLTNTDLKYYNNNGTKTILE